MIEPKTFTVTYIWIYIFIFETRSYFIVHASVLPASAPLFDNLISPGELFLYTEC